MEEEQNGEACAEYGAQIIAQLSELLTHQYGKGFSKRNLAYFRQFYLTISDIRILQSRLQNLAWTHMTIVVWRVHSSMHSAPPSLRISTSRLGASINNV